MLSVIIETRNDEDGLARTLGALVGGAVEGLVREVVVCDRGSTDHTAKVADHAGCVWLVGGEIDAAIRRAKGEWLLFLEPGARPVAGWIDAAARHIGIHSQPARFLRIRDGERLLERLFSRRRPLSDGLLITKRQAQSLARPDMNIDALARAVSPHRLEAQIHAAPKRSGT